LSSAFGHSILVYLCRFAVRSPWILLRGFSRQCGLTHLRVLRLRTPGSALDARADLPTRTAYPVPPSIAIGFGCVSLLRHPIVITNPRWFRNVGLIPIVYAFGPQLRDRLTLSA